MSIASELTALQGDITSARSAIVAKGGTVTSGGGSSQLATDIATIPAGGGGGGSLNAYTFNFTPTSANYERLENIINNAKGRIFVSLFGEAIMYFAGNLGSQICFHAIQYDLNYITEYQLVLKSNRINLYQSATTITGTTPSIEMTDLSEAIAGQSIPITYFNDTEITQ